MLLVAATVNALVSSDINGNRVLFALVAVAATHVAPYRRTRGASRHDGGLLRNQRRSCLLPVQSQARFWKRTSAFQRLGVIDEGLLVRA